MTLIEKAYAILKDWKGDDYIAGLGVLPKLGEVTARFGRKVMLVSMDTFLKPLTDGLRSRSVQPAASLPRTSWCRAQSPMHRVRTYTAS